MLKKSMAEVLACITAKPEQAAEVSQEPPEVSIDVWTEEMEQISLANYSVIATKLADERGVGDVGALVTFFVADDVETTVKITEWVEERRHVFKVKYRDLIREILTRRAWNNRNFLSKGKPLPPNAWKEWMVVEDGVERAVNPSNMDYFGMLLCVASTRDGDLEYDQVTIRQKNEVDWLQVASKNAFNLLVDDENEEAVKTTAPQMAAFMKKLWGEISGSDEKKAPVGGFKRLAEEVDASDALPKASRRGELYSDPHNTSGDSNDRPRCFGCHCD